MKASILAGILAAIFSLFGLHQPLAYQAPTVPAAQAITASAAASVEPAQQPAEHLITYTVQAGDTLSGIAQSFGIPISNILAANNLSQHAILHPGGTLIIPDPQTAPATSSERTPTATSDQTTTSLNVKPVELNSAALSELASASVPTSNFVTQSQFNAGMSALGQSLRQLIADSNSNPIVSGAGAPLSVEAFAPSQAIDQLTNTTLNNITVNGVSGLSASDIPTLDYLSLSGGTLAGDLFLNGNATTTGTSYFTGNVGIGTSTSQDALALNGSTYLADITPPINTANRLYSSGGNLYWAGSVVSSSAIGHWTSDGTNAWRVSGNVGIGTSSPFATLSVVGNGYFSGAIAATGVTATNATNTNFVTTNATSTYFTVSGTASTSALIASNSFTLGSLTGFLKATAGAVATSLVNLASDITGILPVANGGTGWSNLAAGSIPYGNGASAVATTTAGTAGYVLAYLNGVPTWTATTTLSNISGTLAVSSGGTGSTTLSGLLVGNGTSALSAANVSAPLSLSGTTLSIAQANGSTNGYLTSSDWTNFNSKLGSSTVSTLTSNSIPKWIGTAFANSLLTDTGTAVGVGTTSPGAAFGVTGLGYFSGGVNVEADQGYQIGGASILSASSTSGLTLGGIGAGSAFLATTTITGNTAFGYDVLNVSTSSFGNTAFGYKALASLNDYTSDYNTAFGFQALSSEVGGTANNMEDTAVGYDALAKNQTGNESVAVGYDSLGQATSSPENVAVGWLTLNSYMGTGGFNTALGNGVMNALNVGSNDLGIGSDDLRDVVGATNVTAVGDGALKNSTSTNMANQTALGFDAMFNFAGLNSAPDNTAIGANAFYAPSGYSTENDSVAVGYAAGYNVTTGTFNTLLGFQSGYDITTASEDTYLGWNTASTTSTGNFNIALGYDIALPSTNGSNQLDIGNLLFGTGVNGQGTTVSTGNIGIGTTTPWGRLSVVGSDTSSATPGFILTDSNQNPLFEVFDNGTASTTNLNISGITNGSIQCLQVNSAGMITGTGSVCGGTGSIPGGSNGQLQFNNSGSFGASNNLFWNSSTNELGVDNSSPAYALDVVGFINTDQASGYKQAGQTILTASSTSGLSLGGIGAGAGLAATTTAAGDTIFGYQALNVATSSIAITAIGYQALENLDDFVATQDTAVGFQSLWKGTTASDNTALGYKALQLDTSGKNNTAVGDGALLNNTTGAGSIAFGLNALLNNTTGSSNVAIGQGADQYNQTGVSNVAIGVNADGQGNGSAASHSNNTAIGYQAGFDISTGASNIFLGSNAASTTATGSNDIALGSNIDLPTTNGSNQLDIGNLLYGTGVNGTYGTLSTGNIGIGTTSPAVTLAVNGQIATNNLQANASGNTLCYSSSNYGIIGTCTSDERLKNSIVPLSASSSVDMLSAVLALQPVTFKWDGDNSDLYAGFIAQQVQQSIPLATRMASNGYYTLDTTAIASYLTGAIQEIASISGAFEQNLIAWLGSAENGIGDLYASAIHASTGDFSNELCVGSTCVTPAQFQAMVAAASATQSSGQGSGGSSSDNSEASDTPPVIQINGDNPAIVQAGDTYTDLGATITSPQQDLNLGITTYVNGIETSPVQIDTSQAATDTIDYVATDQSGLTSTSTRTIIIEASPSIVPTDDASSTAPTTTP